MKDGKSTKLLMALFQQDIEKNNGPSHISDLMVLTIKCLMPSENPPAVYLDYRRYEEELKLWKKYKHGENEVLLNILEARNPEIYWKGKDDSIFPRILPIILTNRDYTLVKKEVIKNILYTSGNLETLIEGVLFSKLIHLLILDEEEILEKLKDEIIHLTQVDYLEEFQKQYRLPIGQYSGNFSADFERSKIYALSMLNGSASMKFKTLEDVIAVALKDESPNTSLGKSVEIYLKDKFIEEYKDQAYYNDLSLYVHSLEKGVIEASSLRIEKYYLPDIFELKEGEVFYHSLLNKSKIIKKELVGNQNISYVTCKSGVYKFTK